MTTQNIRELAKQLKTEVIKERNQIMHIGLDSDIDRFILEQVEKFADNILSLTMEVHEFTYNRWHPDVLKKFPQKSKEGEET